MPRIIVSNDPFQSFQTLRFAGLISLIVLLCNFSLACASHQDEVYLLSPDSNSDLEIVASEQQEITIAIDTKDLEKDLQGKIPVQIILENESLLFENGEQQIFWHDQINALKKENNNRVNHNELIYLTLTPEASHLNKIIKIRIRKEKDLSRLSALAAFFPQMIPVIFMDEVTFGPKPVIFYEALMRWNYKLLGGDLVKSIRNLVLSQTFGNHKSLATQCSADFIEGFLLFEAANYGETSASSRTKSQTIRAYVMSAPFKRLMDCISNTVASALFDIQKNHIGDEWQYLQGLNKESINGLAKIMVGYGFNTFAFEAGDFFKLLKQTIGFSNAIENLALQNELDRSIVKATQYTLHAGYEDFFKGQLKSHNVNERYALPMATGAGVFEILLRLYAQQGMSGRDQTHQVHSLTKRAEAIGVSFNKSLALPELSELQLLTLGVAIPAVIYGAFKLTTGSDVSSPLFKLFDATYEGMVLGAATHLLSPVLQRYGIWAAHTVQKPILQFMEAEPGSWSEYFLADTIRYRIDVVAENQQSKN
ncbi:hypothetical protein [Endozoicomonas acroporae]|uniref:hypothetical protein n=1 Tax=Endozoicomonas acroporae TaxID=1701104 RepID=UPI0013D51302|nr:hypothetical protein [Endozoicomonas acroporae]